jgi:hypothetical protein
VALNHLECDKVRLNHEIIGIILDAQIMDYAWMSEPQVPCVP